MSAASIPGRRSAKAGRQLSGGERGRLHLAKTLIAGGNVLLLDEPSNDLDVEPLRALEDALLEFAGKRAGDLARPVVPGPDRQATSWPAKAIHSGCLPRQLSRVRGRQETAAGRGGRSPAPAAIQAVEVAQNPSEDIDHVSSGTAVCRVLAVAGGGVAGRRLRAAQCGRDEGTTLSKAQVYSDSVAAGDNLSPALTWTGAPAGAGASP